METLRGPEGARAGGEVTPPHSDRDAAGRGGGEGSGLLLSPSGGSAVVSDREGGRGGGILFPGGVPRRGCLPVV